MKLTRRYVEKPWGRVSLPPIFEHTSDARIGEIWFTGGGDLPLLAKYIFTSEPLSIQVHPSDEHARERGLAGGKAECWYILEAEPGALLGLGLTREVEHAELRAAALDGSIEHLLQWHAVTAGDFVFVPPGTIHAIGAGISLLEFQQNADITYRLYDYGRPRELHLDDGVAVASMAPFDRSLLRNVPPWRSVSLMDGEPFRLDAATSDPLADQQRWIIPIAGQIEVDGERACAGDVVLAEPGLPAVYTDAWALTGARSRRS